MTDYDVVYECACCGGKSTNYLCAKCARENCPSCAALRAESVEKGRAIDTAARAIVDLTARLCLAEKVVKAGKIITRSCRHNADGDCTVHSSLTEPLVDDLRDALAAWESSK